MFRKVVLIAALLEMFSGVSNATRQAPRIFSQGIIEGLYGRFFEYAEDGASSPCPRVIDHFNRGFPSAVGNSWTIPHDKIIENGVKCNDRGVLVLSSFNSTSKMPDRLNSNHFAVETFSHMKRESTGFWMGADARTCGKWVFPNPSFVFFVKEFDRAITTSFRLQLEAGQKYMFVIAPQFICIYVDVPRRSPDPDVVIIPGDSHGSAEGTNGTEPESTSDSSGGAEAEDSGNTESSSESAEDTGKTDSADSNLSIVDIQNGAIPEPTQTPRPGSIQGIREEEDDDSTTAIFNEDDDGEEISATSEVFDIMTETGDSLCFPGSAAVELKNGRKLRMHQLSIGDEIRTGEGYSRVFGFTHKDASTWQTFIRLTTRSGKSITLTAGHYLYSNSRLMPASEVRVGDELRVMNGNGIVKRVEKVTRKGLYNPQTHNGLIVVDGIIATCYTTAVSTWSAHALLTPLRAIWHVFRTRMLTFLETGMVNDELARWWGSVQRLEL